MVFTVEEKRERKNIYNKKRYEKHKEELLEQMKEYYQKNKGEKIKYQKEYQNKNKEKISKYQKEWKEENKDYKKAYDRKYYHDNKEKLYSDERKKSRRISSWKGYGIICEDFDSLYCHYSLAETCDFCNVIFGVRGDGSNSWKCLDHDHETGLFRAILCNKCNCEW